MPISFEINGTQIAQLGPLGQFIKIGEIGVFYGGDEFRGFGITYRGESVEGGSGVVDKKTPSSIVFRTRLVKPIEKEQNWTPVDDAIQLRYINKE